MHLSQVLQLIAANKGVGYRLYMGRRSRHNLSCMNLALHKLSGPFAKILVFRTRCAFQGKALYIATILFYNFILKQSVIFIW